MTARKPLVNEAGTIHELTPPDTLDGAGLNVFVQQTNPGLTVNGIWIEIRADKTVKTFWIETGF